MNHSHPLYSQFCSALQANVKDTSNLTLALSGGVDSVVLLHLVKRYSELRGDIALSAIHVHHGLSENADDWQAFCQNLCDSYGIPLTVAHVEIERASRTSLEAAAREARYNAFEQKLPPDSVVLLGQHRDDQVETFFLRLKRGAGLKGLTGMAQSREIGSLHLVRPLLAASRLEIEAYAAEFGLQHIEDESNLDTEFDRNFLRHYVLPELNRRFRGFDACVARSMDLLREQQALIDEISEADLALCLADDGSVEISILSSLSGARRANVLRKWLAQNAVPMPSKRRLTEMLRQLFEAKRDAQLDIVLGPVHLRRHAGKAYLVTPKPVPDSVQPGTKVRVALSDGRILVCHNGPGIRPPKEDEVVSIRFNLPKSRICPLAKPGSNELTHWFKDAKVAPWLRPGVPLVFYNDTLVQAVGWFISYEHASQAGVNWQEE